MKLGGVIPASVNQALRRVAIGAAGIGVGGLSGCASIDPQAGLAPDRGSPTVSAQRPLESNQGEAIGGTERVIEGDWDDVDAVVDIAVTQSQCGFLDWQSDRGGWVGGGEDRRRWYRLLTIREQEAELELRRESEGPAKQAVPGPIRVRCRVGPDGDSNYERLILDRVAQRFQELKGDKVAPIANPWGTNQ
ncbi:MAG: hypothetical protein AB7K52_01325 [Phycisphaerales bacterium]